MPSAIIEAKTSKSSESTTDSRQLEELRANVERLGAIEVGLVGDLNLKKGDTICHLVTTATKTLEIFDTVTTAIQGMDTVYCNGTPLPSNRPVALISRAQSST